MTRYRDKNKVREGIVLSLYNRTRRGGTAKITSVMRDVSIGHSRLKKKMQELVDSGAVVQKEGGYFLAKDCEYMMDLRRRLIEFPGLDMEKIESLSKLEETRLKKIRTYYKSLLSKRYLSGGQVNWVRLTYDHIMNYMEENSGAVGTGSIEQILESPLKSKIISAAEGLLGRKIDSQRKAFYRKRISTISYNLINLSPQILIRLE